MYIYASDNFKLPPRMQTDASKLGLAGILLQRDTERKLKPVGYFSRRTTGIEAKYHSFELEVLAAVETIERFKIYLLGRRFKLITDCNSMKVLTTKRELIPRIGRWWLRLSEYDFEVEHKPNGQMRHADAFSRSPYEPAKGAEMADIRVNVITLGKDDWLLTLQVQDGIIKENIETLQCEAKTTEQRQIKKEYVLQKGRLCKKTDQDVKWVVPRNIIWRVIRGTHGDMGHCGVDRTIENLQKHYWFTKMRKKVE